MPPNNRDYHLLFENRVWRLAQELEEDPRAVRLRDLRPARARAHLRPHQLHELFHLLV